MVPHTDKEIGETRYYDMAAIRRHAKTLADLYRDGIVARGHSVNLINELRAALDSAKRYLPHLERALAGSKTPGPAEYE